jgi:hypothetical protein
MRSSIFSLCESAESVDKIANSSAGARSRVLEVYQYANSELPIEYRLVGVCAVRLALACSDRPVRWRDNGALNIVRTDETKGHRRSRPAGEFGDQMNPDISKRI